MTAVEFDAALAPFTTLRVGGPAERLVTARSEQELLDLARETWSDGGDWFVLGGGSNVVVADEGFEGTVIRVATEGIAPVMSKVGTVRVRVQAGHSWDAFVAHAVEQGWSGVEALSGIPGSVGAAPIQNIGAYGQEVADSIVSLDFLDAATGEVRRMPVDELELDYRSSVFKRGLRGVVLSVTFELRDAGADARAGAGAGPDAGAGSDALSAPVRYPQLAKALGIELGDSLPVAEVRRAVLWLRASKGMVLDAADADSVSAGSFFTNPIVTESFARTLPSEAPRWQIEPDEPDLVIALEPEGDQGTGAALGDDRGALPAEYHVKLSAAWLIEHAGIAKGFSLPGSTAAISSKHTLALTNRAGEAGTAADVAQLARYVQARVQGEFGVLLQPEPVFVGHTL
ncbi:UDP-N-acetylmuramate dehydrogenase [Herbiconiux sp. KACC 21604]|uniref:UDP-N-acetylmuramate dehydrogenase n=1 Tax=unclassified Herbiconiux TaxID=2618217 RepID=UPI001491E16B|nr:UDP-N-acetylmuramate dehydrogenase [Herbiconiux sp. SALV-R1]QJU54704.1 UDP-N-acetylmuramate dehydrogenase [Herbiconiux sp. SALV-R1]WPO85808.1 UDP-N-acetylmuramate dehydrogenase [Herbiconiux sp. KACC 21604]